MDDFVEVYDIALDPAICTALIRRVEASGKAHRGNMPKGGDKYIATS